MQSIPPPVVMYGPPNWFTPTPTPESQTIAPLVALVIVVVLAVISLWYILMHMRKP